MPGPQVRTAWLQASEMGVELAEVSSCRAVASSLAGFKGRCPLPWRVPAAGVRGSRADGPPGRFSVPEGTAHRESVDQPREKDTVRRGLWIQLDKSFKIKEGEIRVSSQHCRDGSPANQTSVLTRKSTLDCTNTLTKWPQLKGQRPSSKGEARVGMEQVTVGRARVYALRKMQTDTLLCHTRRYGHLYIQL